MNNRPTYIASCSFGKDSLATILLALGHNEPLDRAVFCEVMFDHERGISGELPEHIAWVHNVAIPKLESWGVKVDDVRAERDYIYYFRNAIRGGDLVLAFFPCIYFCDVKTLYLQGSHIAAKNWSLTEKADRALHESKMRQMFYERLWKLVSVIDSRGLRCIIENPWNTNGQSYLQLNFIPPTIIDKNRMMRGDEYVKPTAYWFIGCENTIGYSLQRDKKQKTVDKGQRHEAGICGEERSAIHPDYARNFICDFILGKTQVHTQQSLF